MTDIPIHTASGTTVYHYDGTRLVSTEFLPAVVSAAPPAVQYLPDGRMVNPPPPLPSLPGNPPTDKTLAQIEAELRRIEKP